MHSVHIQVQWAVCAVTCLVECGWVFWNKGEDLINKHTSGCLMIWQRHSYHLLCCVCRLHLLHNIQVWAIQSMNDTKLTLLCYSLLTTVTTTVWLSHITFINLDKVCPAELTLVINDVVVHPRQTLNPDQFCSLTIQITFCLWKTAASMQS